MASNVYCEGNLVYVCYMSYRALCESRALQELERCVVKAACTVLRGRRRRKPPDPPGTYYFHSVDYRNREAILCTNVFQLIQRFATVRLALRELAFLCTRLYEC